MINKKIITIIIKPAGESGSKHERNITHMSCKLVNWFDSPPDKSRATMQTAKNKTGVCKCSF